MIVFCFVGFYLLLPVFVGDNNISFRNDSFDMVVQPLSRSVSQLENSLQLQVKTRASLHETPRYLHQLSVALVGLQDRLPSVCSIKIIPT